MDFFRSQDRARSKSRGLVLSFLAATLGVAIIGGFILAWLLVVTGAAPGQHPADFGLVLAVSVLIAAVILLAAAFRHRQLAAGGGEVARSVGGRAVTGEESDPRYRRLENIVEEMAIAAGLPVPAVYVLDQESGINAFAAGLGTRDAAIAVTRGALESLTRDELQGVIGHEFSHILNGDMRLNQRLLGYLFGLMVVSLIGRTILEAAGRGRMGRSSGSARAPARGALGLGLTGAPALAVAGLGLIVLGWLGVLAGRVLQAAVSRQRELLADASAVQFTRNPSGLAGALRKIAASGDGSRLRAARRDEVRHMLFAEGRRFAGLLATHPSIEQRLQALEPGRRPAAGVARPRTGLAGEIGHPGPASLVSASRLLGSLPPAASDAAHGDWDAPLLALALIAAPQDDLRDHQLSAAGQALGVSAADALASLARSVRPMADSQRLALLDLAAPALRRQSPPRRETLATLGRRFAEADGVIAPLEEALLANLDRYLSDDDPDRPARRPATSSPATAALGLVRWMADAAAGNASAAFAAGRQVLVEGEFPGVTAADTPPAGLPPAGAAVILGQMDYRHRATLIEALESAAREDGVLKLRETSLLRACCAALECPAPRELDDEVRLAREFDT